MGRTQVHFAAPLLHVRHIPKPISAAHVTLRIQTFQSIADNECVGTSLAMEASRIAVPNSATAKLRRTSPENRRARIIMTLILILALVLPRIGQVVNVRSSVGLSGRNVHFIAPPRLTSKTRQ